MLKVFTLPVLIAVISLWGLLAALVWDGTGERIAVMAVAVPVLVMAWAIWRRHD